jgi:hypothetical protein
MVRLAILISLAALGLAARADGPLVRCALGNRVGYILPQDAAAASASVIKSSLPDAPTLEGFWTPSEADVLVGDRVLRELLESAIKNPTILFPDLPTSPPAPFSETADYQRVELSHVVAHYDEYDRQYVGLVIKGERFMLCHYAIGPGLNPAEAFLDMRKLFVPDRKMHFLQARFDPVQKTVSNVAFIGPWQSTN